MKAQHAPTSRAASSPSLLGQGQGLRTELRLNPFNCSAR
jgi:hypothetical protein